MKVVLGQRVRKLEERLQEMESTLVAFSDMIARYDDRFEEIEGKLRNRPPQRKN